MQEKIKAIYNNHIIKAELATMAAYETTDQNPAQSNDEIAIAIHHLQSAKTQLENLRNQKPK